MAKSPDAKSVNHSTSALDAELRRYHASAGALLAAAADSIDPAEVQVRAAAAMAQLREAGDDGTPELLYVGGNRGLAWLVLLGALLEDARTAANKPGARTLPPEVPKESQIEPAIELAEGVRRRVVQAIDSNRWDAEATEALRLQVLGNRKQIAGKARWDNEMASIIRAIEELGPHAPAPLRALLPKLNAAATQLAQARPQPPGRARTAPIYSQEALLSALALDLALGDLRAWAAAAASDKRNGAILRAVSPKRRSDSKAAGGEPGDGAASGANGAAQDRPASRSAAASTDKTRAGN